MRRRTIREAGVVEDPRPDVAGALLKVVGIAIAVGVVIALVALGVVKVLGVGAGNGTAGPAASPNAPLSSLPTTALTPSGSPAEDPAKQSESPEQTPTAKQGRIQLSASPVSVQPSQRINLTGTYPGHDNVQLQVQRKENGAWSPFSDVQASVKVGAFGTWVQTARQGKSLFRVYDPATSTASNPVTVTVG